MGAGLAFSNPAKWGTSGASPTSISAINYTVIDTAGGGQRIVLTVVDSTGCTSAQVSGGGPACTAFAIDDATHVSCLAPAHAAGAVSFTVTNGGGPSAPFAGAQYWNPTVPSGAQTWIRLDLGVTTISGAKITNVLDQSGIGDANRNLAQATGTKQPMLTTLAGLGGQAVAQYDRTADQYLQSGAWSASLNTPRTMFVVGESTAEPANQYFADGLSQNVNVIVTNGGNVRAYAGTGVVGSSGHSAASPVAVVVVGYDDSPTYTGTVRVSANTAAGSGTMGNGPMAGLTLGNSGAPYGFGLTGYIAEYGVWNRVLTGPEIATLNAYCAQRYGLTIAP